jgi:hypothetical protein
MASTGSVYPDARIKDPRGNIISFGRVKVGANATLEARDFELRTLKSVSFTPQQAYSVTTRVIPGSIGSTTTRAYSREFVVMMGSVGSRGALNNNLVVNALRVRTFGSITSRSAGAQGTKGVYMGTQAGSFGANYIAVGL